MWERYNQLVLPYLGCHRRAANRRTSNCFCCLLVARLSLQFEFFGVCLLICITSGLSIFRLHDFTSCRSVLPHLTRCSWRHPLECILIVKERSCICTIRCLLVGWSDDRQIEKMPSSAIRILGNDGKKYCGECWWFCAISPWQKARKVR